MLYNLWKITENHTILSPFFKADNYLLISNEYPPKHIICNDVCEINTKYIGKQMLTEFLLWTQQYNSWLRLHKGKSCMNALIKKMKQIQFLKIKYKLKINLVRGCRYYFQIRNQHWSSWGLGHFILRLWAQFIVPYKKEKHVKADSGRYWMSNKTMR